MTVWSAWQSDVVGIYNVAGTAVIPWRTALELARAITFPVPAPIASVFIRTAGNFPQYLINFFRYPCVISDRAFQKATGWAPTVSAQETLWSTVAQARAMRSIKVRVTLSAVAARVAMVAVVK